MTTADGRATEIDLFSFDTVQTRLSPDKETARSREACASGRRFWGTDLFGPRIRFSEELETAVRSEFQTSVEARVAIG